MGRPMQNGLRYFSFDTDFFYADKRIRALRTRFGSDGLIFYIYLLTEIYRNGYYLRWDEDALDGALELGLAEGLIEQILTFLVSRSLLVKSILANSDTILSAPGIQKRYQEAVKGLKRDVPVDSEIWLLEESETASFIKVTSKSGLSEKNSSNSEKNSDKSQINDTKEIKRKEKKINNIDTNVSIRTSDEARILNAWNGLKDVGIKSIRSILSNRKKLLDARINEYGIDSVLEAIENIRYSTFLQGGSKRGWMIDFDWFIKPNNFPKVLEDKYTDLPKPDKQAELKPQKQPEKELSDDEWFAIMQKGDSDETH